MKSSAVVALDIGGTTINAGRYQDGVIKVNNVVNFAANQSENEVLEFIIQCIDKVITDDTAMIAIGVPCIVDIDQGIVFDAVNIPAWQEYNLKQALIKHYNLTVYINNDVNCFVAGEYSHGMSKQYKDLVGICLGTGFGSGMIINHHLHAGHSCCAGEVGGIPYLDATIDDYCSGSYFQREFNCTGAALAKRAEVGDKFALDAFDKFGQHLAKAISHILFVIDPQIIVIGGSVAQSYDLFIDSVWQELEKFPYQVVVRNLKIVKSELDNAALLGATHLALEHDMKCSA